MSFTPKNQMPLEQALRSADLKIIEGWKAGELRAHTSQSPEGLRRKNLIDWFRRELFAGSFDCSYWSASGYFTKIPPKVFGLGESEQLLTGDTAPEESSSIPTGDILQNDRDWLRRGAVTWVDGLPGTPYWLSSQIESATGRELFISTIDFEAELKKLGGEAAVKMTDVVVSRPSHRPPEKRNEAALILRKLDPALLTGKRAALLAEVNAKLNTPVSIDTLRRALQTLCAEG